MVARLAQENVNLTGGRLQDGQAEYMVRTIMEIERAQDLNEIIVDSGGQGVVRLQDIARIVRGHKEREVITRIDGREAVEIAIYKEGGTNTVTVVDRLTGQLDSVRARLESTGRQLELTVITDQARYIRQSVADVLQSALGITDNVKGTLVVGGFTTWSVQASSRNYAVDAAGRRFGIAVPGLRTIEPLTTRNLWIIPGLQQNAEMRSNLIMAGAVPQQSTVVVRVMKQGQVAGERRFTVPGYGLKQVNRVASTLGAGNVNAGYLEIEVESGAIFATLSVVDGTADDAALIVAEPVLP